MKVAAYIAQVIKGVSKDFDERQINKESHLVSLDGD